MPNPIQKITSEPQKRSMLLERMAVDEEQRTVELAFSSEIEVPRSFGIEVLDHSPESVRLSRLQDGGAVLVDHDTRDHVGVVESVSIDSDRRGRATVRFGSSTRAMEVFNDVKDGIRRHVSVGYRVFKAVAEEMGDEEETRYRVTDWEPHEISIVSVPADPSVGIGRNLTDKGETMSDKENKPKAPAVDNAAIANEVRKQELARITELEQVGQQYNAQDLARELINSGGSVNDLNKKILERMGHSDPVEAKSPEIGLSEQEQKRYSFLRALNALANPTDRTAQEKAAFEYECSRAASEATGKSPEGILVPVDVLKRDLNVGTAAQGGDLVATDLLSGSFIDMLRNRAVMMRLATVLTGLNGNIAIPRQTGGATAYWVAESGAPTESTQAVDQVTLSPKTVGAYTEYTRKMLLQSSIDVEAFVRADLAATLALEIDRAAINGSGASNQPTGILNTTGIGDVAGGTDGLAPTWAHIVDLETQVATANADVSTLRYVTNAKVRGKLKTTEKATNTAQFIMVEMGGMNGYESIITNQVPSNLTKGSGTNLSAIVFGNFADLIIGMWGGLDLTVNPYAMDTSGGVRVTVLQDIDLAVRHAESFAAMQDAITA